MSPASPAAIRTELARFAGTWRQVRCEADGIESPPEEFGPAPTVTFVDDTFVVRNTDGSIVIEGSFRLDPTCDPKEVDWIDTVGEDAGKTFLAIYTLEGDTLTFCAADEGLERPREFRTRSGETLRVHHRLPRSET